LVLFALEALVSGGISMNLAANNHHEIEKCYKVIEVRGQRSEVKGQGHNETISTE